MDTITHGIAGALIGKAVFRGDDMFAVQAHESRANHHLVADARRNFSGLRRLSRHVFAQRAAHTHLASQHHAFAALLAGVCAVLLAALTRWFARWRKWDAPSLAALAGIYAIGILSHILLDLVTSFGTMIWSPLKWSRPHGI